MSQQSDQDPWEIEHCGGKYRLRYDQTRKYLQPKWYVIRVNDLRVSSRWYSWPEGAFLALRTGAVVWT